MIEVLETGDCNSATVLRLDNAPRSELEDLESGVDDKLGVGGIRMDTVLLSQVHTVKNPIDLAFDSLRETFHNQGEGTGEPNIDTDECVARLKLLQELKHL